MILGNHVPRITDAYEEKLEVTSITKHSSYFLAILTLEKSVTLNSHIKTIPLATREPEAGSVVYVAGWGRTESGGAVYDTNLQVCWSAMCTSELPLCMNLLSLSYA